MKPSSLQDSACPEELLLWFVNQTASASQREKVKAHLAHCRRCQREVAWLQRVRQELKNTPVQPPGELGLKRLLKRVRNDKSPPALPGRRRPGWWRPALAIAASLVIIVQAGLLLHSWFGSSELTLLSSPPAQGVVLQITFSPTTTEQQIREIVNSVGGTFIGGPGVLGVYRIQLNLNREDNTAIQQALARLSAQENIVTHVAQE